MRGPLLKAVEEGEFLHFCRYFYLPTIRHCWNLP